MAECVILFALWLFLRKTHFPVEFRSGDEELVRYSPVIVRIQAALRTSCTSIFGPALQPSGGEKMLVFGHKRKLAVS